MTRFSRGVSPNAPAPTDVHPVLRRTAAPSAATGLLAEAQYRLDEATGLPTPNERYATAHLAALRAAAAVLAARSPVPPPCPRGRAAAPKRRRRSHIRSAWETLPEAAPELAEWSVLFAAGAPRRARAEAGIAGAASPAEADAVIQAATAFLARAGQLVAEQPALPAPRAR